MSRRFRFQSIRPVRVAIACLVAATSLSCLDEMAYSYGPAAPPTGPAVRLEVLPNSLEIPQGGGEFLSALAYDRNGFPVRVTIKWTVSDSSIATIEVLQGSPFVTAVAPGTATMTAVAGALRASVVVTVLPPLPPR